MLQITKLVMLSFAVLSLSLTQTTAKERTLPDKKNAESELPQTELLVERSQNYDNTSVYDFENTASLGYSNQNSHVEFEEIMTKLDSSSTIAIFPEISINATSYGNHFEAGNKVQRILQELLPLNIY